MRYYKRVNMVTDRKQFEQCQRIQVSKCAEGPDKMVKISVERYDEALGWYMAGSLCIPLHQLPLLQQSLDTMSNADCSYCSDASCPGKKIIPFPTLERDVAAISEVVS